MTSNFVTALQLADRPLIMEVKRRDPHGNDLLGDRSVAQVVATYEAAGAPCISVVTGHWFGGTPDLLREVARYTDRPILQKDFITRRDQVTAAGRLGASAVLLTAALLTRSAIRNLVETALAADLTPFVEVTGEAEIEAVPYAEHCVIAVNNKDIKTRERGAGDLDRSLRLLPALLDSGTPCPVSASGIDRAEVAADLLARGFAGLLIGTSLLRTTDLAEWLDTLDASRRAPVGAVPALTP
jgi:indole-3-glycerol phosphate synthase